MRIDEVDSQKEYKIIWDKKGSSSGLGAFYIKAKTEKEARSKARKYLKDRPLQFGFDARIVAVFEIENKE